MTTASKKTEKGKFLKEEIPILAVKKKFKTFLCLCNPCAKLKVSFASKDRQTQKIKKKFKNFNSKNFKTIAYLKKSDILIFRINKI